LRVLYLVCVYIDPKAVDAATTFGGNGRLYLMGALAISLTLPPKSVLIQFHPQKPTNNYQFNLLRLQFFRKSLEWDADAYVSLDTDNIHTTQFHPTVLEVFRQYPCFGGAWSPKVNSQRQRWIKPLQEVSRFVGYPSPPYKFCAGLVGAVKPIWDEVTRLSLSWFVNYYLRHSELRAEKRWGFVPMEEHFLTVAFAPYYFDGRFRLYILDWKGSEDPFPDPTFRYGSAHNQCRAVITRHLRDALKDYENIKVKEALEIMQERQIVLVGNLNK
jgi:hypothetical protein